MKQNEKISDKPRTVKELAIAYSVSVKTLKNWLKCDTLQPILGDKIGYYFNVKQVKAIVEHLGNPD